MTHLTRNAAGVGAPAPVRVVHLGLGIFHRAHQAWYTEHANQKSGDPAGIASFTGRRPDAARPIRDQEGLYHLAVRGPNGAVPELVTSISEGVDGNDLDALAAYAASPKLQCITLTVTEAGYRRDAQGRLATNDPEVRQDLSGKAPITAPGRIVYALRARRDADAGPIAVVSCDNLTDNQAVCRQVVLDMAAGIDTELADWISSQVSFVGTMVDRITPRTTDADLDLVRSKTGFDDHAVVVTEPFVEWVLAGEFPAGRPAWDLAGARFVSDVRPFEQRKLWLLNGSHSLLAYAGAARGHHTVAEAIADETCREWVRHWWEEASRHLSLPNDELAAYTDALLERYRNPSIRHQLTQIQMDGSQKLPIRVLPVLARERANGDLPVGAVTAFAGWIVHLRAGTTVSDPLADQLTEIVRQGDETATRQLLELLTPQGELADDAELVNAVAVSIRRLSRTG